MSQTRMRWLAAGLFWASVGWAQPANLSGIAHVAFRVADLEAARAFYHKLGFEQFYEMKQGGRTTEAFLKINDRQFLELYPVTDAAQPVGLMHVCYESIDLEALHTAYAARGLAVSEVRQAGAGNLLMTIKDPEGQTIEFTQYMPGSRHYQDRGQHLGANRVAQAIEGARTLARDAPAVRAFYVDKLGFTANGGDPTTLRLPGDSRQELEIAAAAADAKAGIRFGVPDVQAAARRWADLGFSMRDPDGSGISLVRYQAK